MCDGGVDRPRRVEYPHNHSRAPSDDQDWRYGVCVWARLAVSECVDVQMWPRQDVHAGKEVDVLNDAQQLQYLDASGMVDVQTTPYAERVCEPACVVDEVGVHVDAQDETTKKAYQHMHVLVGHVNENRSRSC